VDGEQHFTEPLNPVAGLRWIFCLDRGGLAELLKVRPRWIQKLMELPIECRPLPPGTMLAGKRLWRLMSVMRWLAESGREPGSFPRHSRKARIDSRYVRGMFSIAGCSTQHPHVPISLKEDAPERRQEFGVKQISHVLQLCRATIYNLMARSQRPFPRGRKVGKRRMWRVGDVLLWFEDEERHTLAVWARRAPKPREKIFPVYPRPRGQL
jgi:predicted DNA-binding transcriptional regulator AlpA